MAGDDWDQAGPEPGRGREPGAGRGPDPIAARRAAILIVVAVVLGILLLQVGSRPVAHLPSTPASASPPTTTVPPTTTTTVAKGSIHVLVANGTTAPTSATDYVNSLQSQGWATLPPEDTTVPAASSAVYFAPGKQAAAAALAAAVGVKASAVQPISSAVPVSSTTGADVVLILGPGLANSGPAASTTTTT